MNVCPRCQVFGVGGEAIKAMKRYVYLMELPDQQTFLEGSQGAGTEKQGLRLAYCSELLRLASYVQLPGLLDYCVQQFVQDLCISNAIQRFNYALDHGLPPPVHLETRRFIAQNIYAIQVSLGLAISIFTILVLCVLTTSI